MNGGPSGGNFTHKAQEALFQAQNSAQERGQQQVDALHLLFALISSQWHSNAESVARERGTQSSSHLEWTHHNSFICQ